MIHKIRTFGVAVGAVLLIVGLSAAPASASAKTVDTTPPTVTMDDALHFVTGQLLSGGTTVLKAAWQQHDASGICSESGTVQGSDAMDENNKVVATFTGVRTTFDFKAHVPDGIGTYSITIKVTDCSPKHNSTTAEAVPLWANEVYQQNEAGDGGIPTVYSAGWKTSSCTCFSGGTVLYSTTVGASMTFHYEGSGLGLVTEKASNRGTAAIYVDGVKKATMNNKSSKPINSVIGFSAYFNDIDNNSHTLKVVVLSGRIDIDAFVASQTQGEGG